LVFSILGLGSTLVGCDASEGGELVIRSDSAGVEIVETHRAAWSAGSEWTIKAEPFLTIGEVAGDPPYLFSNIRGVVRFEDGGIVVGDGQSREVRFFDEHGLFVRSVGGPGDGPSEFPIALERLEYCGLDRLYAVDPYARRVVAFNRSGDFRGTVELSEPDSDRLPYGYECRADGGFVAIGWGAAGIRPELPAGQEAMMYSQDGSIWVLDSLNAVIAELGQFLSSERLFIQRGVGYGSGPHPFGRATKFAVSGEWIYHGTGEGLAVRVYRDGSLTRIQRTLTEHLALDEGMIQRYYDSDMSGLDAHDREILEVANAFPPEVPGFTELLASPDGYLWAKRFTLPGEGTNRWGVFAPDGQFLGHVELPERFALFEVGNDYLLGVSRDELEVERVELYQLNRP
jgi:hypothetical protein